MPTTDPIADMLTRIRNATTAQHPEVAMESSRIRQAIADILQQEGYIGGYELIETGKPQPRLLVKLLYDKDKQPSIRGLKRISKPGLRVYTKRDDIPRPLSGLGLAILSTPQGVMSGRQAYKRGVGGEVLAYVW
jgi:small subunit ribosomal protein S8